MAVADLQPVRNKLYRARRSSRSVLQTGTATLYASDSVPMGRQGVLYERSALSLQRTKHSWEGVTEIVSNIIGTAGFFVGSLYWALGAIVSGSLIFAAANVFCGTACTIYAVKFWKMENYIGVYALLQQSCGCLIFLICSFLFLEKNFLTVSLIGFFAASLLFTTGCLLMQIQCRSYLGVLASPFPCWHFLIIPTSFFNTLGSILFTLGSIALFYPYQWATDTGAWLYTIGSAFFVIASWGDATLWWNEGRVSTDTCSTAEHTVNK